MQWSDSGPIKIACDCWMKTSRQQTAVRGLVWGCSSASQSDEVTRKEIHPTHSGYWDKRYTLLFVNTFLFITPTLHFNRNNWIIWSIGANYWKGRCFLQEFRIECMCWQKEPQQCFSQDCARLILLPLWVKWDIHHVRHHARELNLYCSGLQIPCIVLHLWMWNIHTRWTEAISSIGSFLLLKDQIHSRQLWRSGPPKENNAMR